MAFQMKGRSQEIFNQLGRASKNGSLAPALVKVYLRRHSTVHMNRWSLLNRLTCQLHEYTDCRTYNQWQEAGRYVAEKADTYILAPIKRTWIEEDADGEKRQSQLVGFKSLAVWDITQTKDCTTDKQGEPLPDDNQGFLNTLPLLDVAERWGIKIHSYDGVKSGALGFIQGNDTIGLGVENTGTWLHELVHAADMRNGTKVEKAQHWRSEIVAEFGSHVLAGVLGFQTDEGGSYAYVSHYAKKANLTIQQAISTVFNRVDAVIQLILNEAELSNA